MDKKTIIITGASSGIGKAAAKLLKEKGHEVVIVGRSPERTKAVGEELGVDYYIADFTKLNDVRELGQKLHMSLPACMMMSLAASSSMLPDECSLMSFSSVEKVRT